MHQHHLRHALSLTALLLGSALLSTANAAIITDPFEFESSLGSFVTDDFENPQYALNQTSAEASSVFGESTYSSTGLGGADLIIVNSYAGDHYLCGGCNASFAIDFTNTSVSDSNGVYGVGFDYYNQFDPLYFAYVTYGDGSTENIALDQFSISDPEFFGITSDLLISSIHFGLEGGGSVHDGNFGLYNLTIGDAASVTEPATFGLLSLALLGMGLARRNQN